jgi:hypothetical protein
MNWSIGHRLSSAARIGGTIVAATVLAAAVLLGRPHGPTPETGSTGSPAPGPFLATEPPAGTAATPLPGLEGARDCRVIWAEVDRVDPSQEIANPGGVVLGTVVDVDGSVRWASADGRMPVGIPYDQLPEEAYRLAHLRVTFASRTAVGAGGLITVRIPGGTLPGALDGDPSGCTTISYSGMADFAPGSSVALFLGRQPHLGIAPTATSDVIDSWPVAAGVVSAPDGTKMSVQAFSSAAGG